jgi:hypothetical protein
MRGEAALAAAEVDPGAGALGLCSEKGVLTKSFRLFGIENRPKKLGEYRPSLRGEEGEWRPLRGLLQSTPGPGPESPAQTRGSWRQSFAHKAKDLTKLGAHRPSLRKGEGEWRPLLLKSTTGGALGSARKRSAGKKNRPFSVDC